MSEQEFVKEINDKIKDIAKQVNEHSKNMVNSDYKEVKASLSCASSALNRAAKQLNEIVPMEGQMDIGDFLDIAEMER